jgi:hypothetical protein
LMVLGGIESNAAGMAWRRSLREYLQCSLV